MRALFAVLFAAGTANAGTKLLQNDGFTGTGTVNSAVSFLDYEGAAAIFTPDGGYPLKVIAIDVLSVTYNQGASGAIGGYQLDVWDESGGLIDPPRNFDGGGLYRPRVTQTNQLTTSSSQFNRIMLNQPLMVNSGRLFVSLGEQLSTADDSTTIAIDTTPLVPGANWWRTGMGAYYRLDLPDGGFYRGVNHNWILRVVLEVPDTGVGVTSVFPSSGPTSSTTPVVISGSGFELGATAFVGTTALTVTGTTPPTSLQATVPAGITPGTYDVKVQNPGGAFGLLANGFQVLLPDGGGGTGGGAGGGGGGAGGGAGGGSTGALVLEAITPNEGYNQEITRCVLVGDGFKMGAQVLVGPQVISTVEVRSTSVINADVPTGINPGVYDVVVINLDGMRSTLPQSFTVIAGARTKGGCGCSEVPLGAALLCALIAWGRRGRGRAPKC